MAFRRRSKTAVPVELDDSAAGTEIEATGADESPEAESPEAESPESERSGPWDVEEAPETETPRLDLGGLQVPTLPDVEIRLETDPAGAVDAVVLVAGSSALRLGAFAAPRRAGIWDAVRSELLAGLEADGGSGEERPGPFGPELLAAVPSDRGKQTARFVGVDGPRWLLRGVFTGPAATNRVQAEVLERALREVVVARGAAALPVRDPLPLALPAELIEQAEEEADRHAPGAPRRGPEITEIG